MWSLLPIVAAMSVLFEHQTSQNVQIFWAAWYNTWLLITLTREGVVFSFLFLLRLYVSNMQVTVCIHGCTWTACTLCWHHTICDNLYAMMFAGFHEFKSKHVCAMWLIMIFIWLGWMQSWQSCTAKRSLSCAEQQQQLHDWCSVAVLQTAWAFETQWA